MKRMRSIFVLVCLALNTVAFAVTYSPYKAAGSKSAMRVRETSFTVSSYSALPLAASQSVNEGPVVPHASIGSTRPAASAVHYTTVKTLNTDGSVSAAYTTDGTSSGPRYSRGLDVDDDDDPNASLVPVGDIPWLLFLILAAAVTGFKKRTVITKRAGVR